MMASRVRNVAVEMRVKPAFDLAMGRLQGPVEGIDLRNAIRVEVALLLPFRSRANGRDTDYGERKKPQAWRERMNRV
jgi:hypothetical protein